MKRLGVIVGVFLLCLLLTVGMVVLCIRSSRVQTSAIHLLTDHLQQHLGTELTIDKVDIRFFNKLSIQGVYLSDQQGDTLLYVPELLVRFNPFALQQNRLDFPLVRVCEPYFALAQDSTGTNLDFLLRAFAPQHRDTSSSFDMLVNIDDVEIQDARIRYRHTPDNTNLLVSHLNTHVTLPLISRDTISAQLLSLTLQAELKDIDARFEGAFHGSMDTLYADELELWYRNRRILLGNIMLGHPLLRDSMFVRADLTDLYCNRVLLQDLLSDLTHKPQTLPKQIARLGDVHYRGFLAGRLDSLFLHGAFLTDRGGITTDAVVHTTPQFDDMRFEGRISTRHFELGRLLGTPMLGSISTTLSGHGHWHQGMPLSAQAEVDIHSVYAKGYTYRNIHIEGGVEDSVFEGSIDVHDPNVDLTFNGLVEYSKIEPEANYHLDLRHLRLQELGIHSPKIQNQDLSFSSDLYFTTEGDGTKAMDRVNGHLIVEDIHLTNHDHEWRMRSLKMEAESQNGYNVLRVHSDFLTIGMSGSWLWSTLGTTFRAFAHDILPSFVSAPAVPNARPNEMEFYLYSNHSDSLFNAMGMQGLSMPDNQIIKGFISESKGLYGLQAYVPLLIKGNTALQDFTLSLSNRQGQADLAIQVIERLASTDSTRLKVGNIGIFFNTTARNDSLITSYSFGGQLADHKSADVHVTTHFSRIMDNSWVNVHIDSSQFYVSDTLWTIADANIYYSQSDSSLAVHGFDLHTGTQSLRINGVASSKMDDAIRIDLQNINLAYLLQYTGVSNALDIQGMVSGWATLYSLFSKKPVFEAELTVPHAVLNSADVGDLKANATIDHDTKHVLIAGDIVQNNRRVAHIDGTVMPERPYWELYIHADSLNLALINRWTGSFMSDLQGRGFGDVHVFGRKINTWVTARVLARDVSMTIPFTGARYHLSDSIIMDTTSIALRNIRFTDDEHHQGILDGLITHDKFHDFRFRIGARFTDLTAIDLPYDPQALYYGKAYVSGRLDIEGDDQGTRIDVDATTDNRTDFYLSVATAASAKDNGFITFVQPEQDALSVGATPAAAAIKPNSKTKLNLTMDITPQARIHLMLASHSSDGLTCRGSGNIRLSLEGNDTRMLGTYTIDQGVFAFTLGNLIHRDFTISEGSSVTWNGRPEVPILDVVAKYRLTASLKDLFGQDMSGVATNRTSVPVNCVLNMTDKLTSPILKFSIELPQSDESVASQVYAIINTEDMLMRQVIYLLVFNKFFTPDYLKTSSTDAGLSETYSLLSSTVTGQINSWLGKLTDKFSMGFNVRADGVGASASQEYETKFQITPVERLSINGSFGYRYNDVSNRPFFGDMDIEYGITPDGKLRIKGYTHTVDKYSLKTANTVQGIGLIYRYDFNWGDARRRSQARKEAKAKGQSKSK